jgi:hypothetical protein
VGWVYTTAYTFLQGLVWKPVSAAALKGLKGENKIDKIQVADITI